MPAEFHNQTTALGEPIGREAVDAVLEIGEGLFALVKDSFGPHEGVYRISDAGEYVPAFDFESFWADYPGWMRNAWMLADNGQYTSDDVAAMTEHDISYAYHSPWFYPEFAFYTEADETGKI